MISILKNSKTVGSDVAAVDGSFFTDGDLETKSRVTSVTWQHMSRSRIDPAACNNSRVYTAAYYSANIKHRNFLSQINN